MGAKKPIMVKKSSLDNKKKKLKEHKKESSVNRSEILHYIIIIALFCFSLFLIKHVNDLNNKIDKLNKKLEENKLKINALNGQNSTLNNLNSKNLKKISFFDKHVVFRIEGFGNYYYTYDCMIKKVGNNKFTFWAYNIEQARDYGIREGSC